MTSETRLCTMFAGWMMTLYGVRRGSWPGTMIAMLGLCIADGAMTIEKGTPR